MYCSFKVAFANKTHVEMLLQVQTIQKLHNLSYSYEYHLQKTSLSKKETYSYRNQAIKKQNTEHIVFTAIFLGSINQKEADDYNTH